MNVYTTDKIRNVVLLGHGGSGKTSLVEAMAYLAGMTTRMGKVADGNTISDYDKEETKRLFSINTSVIPVVWGDTKINILDTPGYFDFVGEAEEAVSVADAAIIVVSGKAGVQVGTQKAWNLCEKYKLPRMIFVTDMDVDDVSYRKVVEQLTELYGKKIAPLHFPIREDGKFVGYVNVVKQAGRKYIDKGKKEECPIPEYLDEYLEKYHDILMESVAETSEEFMERFFNGEDFTYAEMAQGLRQGVRELSVFPVLCGSAVADMGTLMLLDNIMELLPSPEQGNYHKATLADGTTEEFVVSAGGVPTAFVFKTISDQYGKYSMIKVIRGKVTSDMSLYNMTTGNTEKLGRLYVMKGKKGEETKEICCGDIGAIGKMDRVKTGDTLCDPKNIVKLHGMDYAQPCYSRAISPKTKQEIEKLGTGLNKLNEEDPTFHVVNNAETHQTVISGAGDIQIDVLCAKLKSRFGVDAELSAPRVAYREKIRSTVRKQGRYKKQTGGSGQFGDVHIIFEPQNEQEDMIFEENVFGGSVPKNYFPAVEKGLRESCQHGVLAGYPVVFLKATLVDGSYHPVDSSEIAFKLAANLAFKAALPEAKPVLMEPIGELKVTIPDSYLGDVMGDLNKRRGRVMGMNPTGDGEQVLEAEVPMAEMMSYAIDLRSMTQSRGTFTFNFVRYEDCPAAAQEKAIAEAKALAEAE